MRLVADPRTSTMEKEVLLQIHCVGSRKGGPNTTSTDPGAHVGHSKLIRWEEMSDCFPKVQSGKHLFAAAHSDALALRRRELLDASVHREFLRALAATLRTLTSAGAPSAESQVDLIMPQRSPESGYCLQRTLPSA